jgi:hypothetical protein
MAISSILDPVLIPLVKISPFFAVSMVAIVFSVIVILITKFTTNQTRLKEIKEELAKLRKEATENKEDPKKVMEINSKMMKISGETFKHNIKTSIWTILPAILILGWLGSSLAFESIHPGQEFIVTATFKEGSEGMAKLNVPEGLEIVGEDEKDVKDNKIDWKVKGEDGIYLLEVEYNSKFFTKDVLITEDFGYKAPIKNFKNEVVESISTNNEKLIILNLLSWKIGWFGSYLILSLIIMPLLRKAFKVY